MPFLTIGGNTVEILADSASESEPDRMGEDARAFAGNLRVIAKARKRRFNFSTGLMTEASYMALVAAVDTGVPLTVTGDAMNNVSGSFIVRVNGGSYIRDVTDAMDFKRSAELVLIEV